MPAVLGEDTDGFVKTGGHKLLPSGGIVDIEHRRHVVHVHCDWLVQVSHVIRVETGETETHKLALYTPETN